MSQSSLHQRSTTIMNASRSLRAFQRTFEHAFRTYNVPYQTLKSANVVRSFAIPSPRRIAQQTRARSTATETEEANAEIGREARPLTTREDTSAADKDAIAARKALSPAYQLWFTCKKCLERSGHTVSKQAYHFGTCVINCPKCKSQHLISDNLKIFEDTKMTMEDIAKKYGEKLRKGRLGADGDVEFYDERADEIVAKEGEAKKEQDEMTERIKKSLEPEKT